MITGIISYIRSLFVLPFVFANIGYEAGHLVQADFDLMAMQKDKFGRTPKMMFFCEAGDRHEVIRRWCKSSGWIPLLKIGDGASRIAGVVHPDFMKNIVETQWILAVPETTVGAPGAGPATVGDKSIMWVKLKRGLWRSHIFVTHFTASIDRTQLRNHDERVKHATKHVAALVNLIKRRWGAVWVVGDFNTTWANDILDPLRAIGLLNIKTLKPTHGKRRIDLVMFRFWFPTRVLKRAQRVRTDVQARNLEISSDHDGVMVERA